MIVANVGVWVASLTGKIFKPVTRRRYEQYVAKPVNLHHKAQIVDFLASPAETV